MLVAHRFPDVFEGVEVEAALIRRQRARGQTEPGNYKECNGAQVLLYAAGSYKAYNLTSMRSSFAVLAAVLAVELINSSCASRTSQPSLKLLPKSLAQLRPAIPGSSPLAKPENSTGQVAQSAILPERVTEREALSEDADDGGPADSEEFLRRMRMPGGGPFDPQR